MERMLITMDDYMAMEHKLIQSFTDFDQEVWDRYMDGTDFDEEDEEKCQTWIERANTQIKSKFKVF